MVGRTSSSALPIHSRRVLLQLFGAHMVVQIWQPFTEAECPGFVGMLCHAHNSTLHLSTLPHANNI